MDMGGTGQLHVESQGARSYALPVGPWPLVAIVTIRDATHHKGERESLETK